MNSTLRFTGSFLAMSFMALAELPQNQNNDQSLSTYGTDTNVTDGKTPLDQGASEKDVSTTRKIRKSLMSMKELSVNAQNVKIITRQGQVTLRGLAETMDEKSKIERAARDVAGEGNVDNQIEINSSTSKN